MKVLQVSSRIQEARSTSLQDSTGHIYDKGTQHYAQKNYLLEGEKNKFFCYTDVTSTSTIRQVTRVVSVRLWSSDKALKLFQKVSGLDSSFFPGFPGLLELQVLDVTALRHSPTTYLESHNFSHPEVRTQFS